MFIGLFWEIRNILSCFLMDEVFGWFNTKQLKFFTAYFIAIEGVYERILPVLPFLILGNKFGPQIE